mgnify:CR=1 FL=1
MSEKFVLELTLSKGGEFNNKVIDLPRNCGEKIVIDTVMAENKGGASRAAFRLHSFPNEHGAFAEDVFVGRGTRLVMKIAPLIVHPGETLYGVTNAPGVLQLRLSGRRGPA